jgi:cytochrome b6-f complex iron-sulfur subunit
MENSRREFLMKAGSVALFAALGIQLTSCSEDGNDTRPTVGGVTGGGNVAPGQLPPGVTVSGNTVTVSLSVPENDPLRSQGAWALFRTAGLILINIDGNNFRAFTSVCPHSGCDRDWSFNSSNQRLTCNCHNSIFSATNGNRISGPANRNLQEFSVTRSGDEIVVTR